MVGVGNGFTVTVVVATAVQVPSVPVVVYTVVVGGVAVTTLPVVELNPVAGPQTYVLAPLAVNVAVCCPTQIVPVVAVTIGLLTTVTVAESVFVQPLASVPVTE